MNETCRYCGKRIVQVTYALGVEWVHQEAGAAFSDGVHRFCHSTVAEPQPSGGAS